MFSLGHGSNREFKTSSGSAVRSLLVKRSRHELLLESKELESTGWTEVERDTGRCCAACFDMVLPLDGLIIPLKSERGSEKESVNDPSEGLLYTEAL